LLQASFLLRTNHTGNSLFLSDIQSTMNAFRIAFHEVATLTLQRITDCFQGCRHDFRGGLAKCL